MFFSKSTAWILDYITENVTTLTESIATEVATLNGRIDDEVVALSESIATKLVFVNRGDIAAGDLLFSSMIVDNAFHDWDISGIIDAGAKLVLLQANYMTAGAGVSHIEFKTKGYDNSFNSAYVMTTEGAYTKNDACLVMPDIDGIIQYKIPTRYTNAIFIVRGWFV